MRNPFIKGQTGAAPQTRTAAPVQAQTRAEERVIDQDGQFNPQAQQGAERTYNAAGEVNAYTRREANERVGSSFAQQGTFRRRASAQEREARARKIQAAMNDPSGRGIHLVGKELALPIKEILDYEGWARQVLRVRSLGQAELFRIPKDVRATAWTVGQDGQVLESRLRGRYIQPPEFKIAANVTVDLADILQVNYDILERAQDTARQEIQLEEDKRCVEVLDAAAQTFNSVTSFGSVGPAALEAIRYQVERHRLRVDKFLINRNEVSDIVTTMAASLDPVSQRELNLSGYIGNFMGARFFTAAGQGVQEVVPSGTIYAVTAPDSLGELAERIPLFADPFNKYGFGETVKGWMFVEMIGMAIANSRAVAKGVRA